MVVASSACTSRNPRPDDRSTHRDVRWTTWFQVFFSSSFDYFQAATEPSHRVGNPSLWGCRYLQQCDSIPSPCLHHPRETRAARRHPQHRFPFGGASPWRSVPNFTSDCGCGRFRMARPWPQWWRRYSTKPWTTGINTNPTPSEFPVPMGSARSATRKAPPPPSDRFCELPGAGAP